MYKNSLDHLFNLAQAREKTKQKINCKFCFKSFSLSNIQKHQNSCYLNPDVMVKCSVCQKPIKNYKTSKTCSYSCSNSKFRTGPNNGNWKEESYRSTCFFHHKQECIICQENLIVEVHHLDENKNNNSPENLIPLCPTHHQYWHSKHKHLIENQIVNYVENWKNNRL